jgi:hypothetical protein
MKEKEPEMATEWTEADDLEWLIREILEDLDSCDEKVIEVERRLLEAAVTYLTIYHAAWPEIEALADQDGFNDSP